MTQAQSATPFAVKSAVLCLLKQERRKEKAGRSTAISALALLIWWLCAVAPQAQAQFTYSTNFNLLTVTGYSGPGGTVVIPNAVYGMAVNTIGERVFKYGSNITAVAFSTNLVELGSESFSDCSGLTSLALPSSLGIIGFKAFSGCSGLTNVTIPTNVWTIAGYSFNGCGNLTNFSVLSPHTRFASSSGVIFDKNTNSLVQFPTAKAGNYVVPSTVTNIAYGSFENCPYVTSVTIPRYATNIGFGSFRGCASLTNITVDPLNTVYASSEGVLFKKGLGTLIQCPPGKAGTYDIPAGVTNLGDFSFYGCRNLSNITIAASVKGIGVGAFDNCTGLTNIVIPHLVTALSNGVFAGCSHLSTVSIGSGVTLLGPGAFARCDNLEAFSVDPANPAFSSPDGVLCNKSGTTLLVCPPAREGVFVVASSVTSLSDQAFSYCRALTEIYITNKVTFIGNSCFSGCRDLSMVWIGRSTTSIGASAFGACPSLLAINVDPLNPSFSSVDGVLFNKNRTSLIRFPALKQGSYRVPPTVTHIINSAFSYSTELTSVTLPGSVLSLGASFTDPGDSAFRGCTKLTSVFFTGNAPAVGFNVFYGDTNAIAYYFPATAGWTSTIGSLPTAIWEPEVNLSGPAFGFRTNRFSFSVSGEAGMPIVIEATAGFAPASWIPVASANLTNGNYYFDEPASEDTPARFYRITWP